MAQGAPKRVIVTLLFRHGSGASGDDLPRGSGVEALDKAAWEAGVEIEKNEMAEVALKPSGLEMVRERGPRDKMEEVTQKLRGVLWQISA